MQRPPQQDFEFTAEKRLSRVRGRTALLVLLVRYCLHPAHRARSGQVRASSAAVLTWSVPTQAHASVSDFACDTTVEFGVFTMKFDGHPVDFSGKNHLLFVVDTIALIHVAADMHAVFRSVTSFHLVPAPGGRLPVAERSDRTLNGL